MKTCLLLLLRYILFHHQTTTQQESIPGVATLRYILFHHQTTTYHSPIQQALRLRYILFHHQTTTSPGQMGRRPRCVISSFITKPQLIQTATTTEAVALYPLSSPNHNPTSIAQPHQRLRYILFHHQTTTPFVMWLMPKTLRYILFHHQTTTCFPCCRTPLSCVISSFITKPQLLSFL